MNNINSGPGGMRNMFSTSGGFVPGVSRQLPPNFLPPKPPGGGGIKNVYMPKRTSPRRPKTQR
jgi:hypothetical protein